MLQNFNLHDPVLRGDTFMADEVPYNLIHRICGTERSACVKSSDNTMIFARSEGHKAWVWFSKELAEGSKKNNDLMHELIDFIKDTAVLPGISGSPRTAEIFAQLYAEAMGLQYETQMILEAYSCPQVKKPHHAGGMMRQATGHHLETVAEFMAGFSEDAYGVPVTPSSQIPGAEGMIDAGGLFLWIADGRPVSMANIAHRAPRHARINAVYTPSVYRKKGYASALVAELCSILEPESLIPMLYADLKNPDSNKVYRSIGFVEKGKIVDITFKESSNQPRT